MYVRWNKRKRKPGQGRKAGDYLTAVLVKNTRINGKPRQKIVKSLGSIEEGAFVDRLEYAIVLYQFWWKVDRNLILVNLPNEDREKVIAALKKTVPMVTDEDIKQLYGEEAFQNIQFNFNLREERRASKVCKRKA